MLKQRSVHSAACSAVRNATMASLGLLAACATSGPVPPADRANAGGGETSRALSAEDLEEVEQAVNAGLSGVSRCYQAEMTTTGKRFEAQILLKILIGTEGKAERVEIARSAIDSAEFQRCTVEAVGQMEFPQLKVPTWFTYPVKLEPAY